MNTFNTKHRSGRRSGWTRPSGWQGLIRRVFGRPCIEPIDEATGLPPRKPTFFFKPDLW